MAWSVLQSASGSAAANTVSATFSTANVQAGTKIIAIVSVGATTPPAVTSVKDAALNTWTQVGTAADANARSYIFALDTPAGDVGTKPTLTATSSSTPGLGIEILEVSGLLAGNTTAMVDGTAGALNGTASSTGSPTYSSSVANEFLVSAYGDFGTGFTVVTAGGWTPGGSQVNSSTNSNCLVQYKNSTGGAETDGFTTADTAGWAVVMVAFQLAGGATAPPPATPAQPGRTWLRRFKHRQAPAVPSGTQAVQVSLTDSGAAADSLAIAADVPLADAGAGSDALAVASAVPFTDSGQGSDSLAIIQPTGLTDAGAGADALAITQPTGLSETGQGADSLAIVQPTGLSDSGTGAEALGIMPGLTDTGQGTDSLSISPVSVIPLTDAGSAVDTLGIMPGLTDSGTGTASLAIASTVPLSEAGAGADAFAVTQPTGLSVTGHGTDSLAIVPVTGGATPGSATASSRLAGSVQGKHTAAAVTAASGLAQSVYAQNSAPSVKAANRPAQLVTAGNSI